MNPSDRPQYYGLDVAKLIAAVLVVASHTSPMTGLEESLLFRVYSFFLDMAVPMFALCSGFLLSRKLLWEADPENDLRILKKTFLSLLRLYLLWSLIYFPIALQEPVPEGRSVWIFAARYVSNLFFVGEHYLSWHLWYLLADVYAVALLYLLRRHSRVRWLSGLAALASLGISFFLYRFIADVDGYSGLPRLLSVLAGEVFLDGRLFSGIGYILAGCFFGSLSRTPGRLSGIGLLILGILVSLFPVLPSGSFLNTLGALLPVVAIFLLCILWKGAAPRKIFRVCRTVSSVSYYTHMLWFYVGYLLLEPIPGFTFWGAPAFFWCLTGCALTAPAVFKFQDRRLIRLLF